MRKALCRIGMGLKGHHVVAAFMKWKDVRNDQRYREL